MNEKAMEFLKDFKNLLEKHKATIVADDFYSLTLQIQFKENPEIDVIHLEPYCDKSNVEQMIIDYSDD